MWLFGVAAKPLGLLILGLALIFTPVRSEIAAAIGGQVDHIARIFRTR